MHQTSGLLIADGLHENQAHNEDSPSLFKFKGQRHKWISFALEKVYSHLHLAARARPEHMSPLGIEAIGPQTIEAIEL